MPWTLHPAGSLVPVPWRNGLGTTRDIVTVLAPDGTLRWQVTIADLERDADFSVFPHCDRVFTPIAGDPPPELSFEGDAFAPCPLLVPRHFSGETPCTSRVPAPGRAFNVVFDRRFHAAEVQVVRLGANQRLALGAEPRLVIHCHAGKVRIADDTLHEGDSASGPGNVTLDPAEASVILLAAIRPASK